MRADTNADCEHEYCNESSQHVVLLRILLCLPDDLWERQHDNKWLGHLEAIGQADSDHAASLNKSAPSEGLSSTPGRSLSGSCREANLHELAAADEVDEPWSFDAAHPCGSWAALPRARSSGCRGVAGMGIAGVLASAIASRQIPEGRHFPANLLGSAVR